MKSLLPLFLGAALFTGPVVAAPADPLPTAETAIGEVGATVIRLEDIETGEIHKLRSQLHEAIEQAFRTQALNELRERDPAKYGSGDQAAITEAQIASFYQSNELSKRGTIEQLGPQIRSYLEALQQAMHDDRLYRDALARGEIKTSLAAPLALLIKAPVETAYLYGKRDGQVMLLEFSDFQCPYCQRVQPVLKRLLQQYGDRVAFGYRHFPLDFHNDADSAAIANECAREQGKFTEMHDQLYKQQRNQSVGELKAIAKKIAIADLKKFDSCLDSEKYRPLVARDIEVGKAAGITGTPGFIIGRYDAKKGLLEGELLSGAQPEAAFKQMLEKYLGSSGQ
ncbi:MAG: DsbA family protein [Gammaproteobacteria bacterium]|nr:DsbA family protein [Gammaproteobacteria bacterium]